VSLNIYCVVKATIHYAISLDITVNELVWTFFPDRAIQN